MRFKTSNKLFAHIDCDSFFASCEILKNPRLRGKYVCVGHEIIIACTYNVKKLGIKCGTPVWEAKKILGNKGIFLGVDIVYYSEVSKKLMSYLKYNTLSIEKFSIDEAFCEIKGLPELHKMSLDNYLKYLQNDILNKIGIPVSIGVAQTRIKAKIFSKINKPFGFYYSLDSITDKEIFSKLHFSIIPFIGKSYQNKLKYSCKTVYDFVHLGYWYLKDNIGKNATDLRLELVGVNAFIVKKNKEIKSMSRGRSFNKNISNNREYLQKQLLLNFNWLYEEFINTHYELKTVSIFLRDKNFITHTHNYSFPEHTYIRSDIYHKIIELFTQNFDQNNLYRSTGVVFSSFRSYKPSQTSLFDKPLRDKTNFLKLSQTINKINSHYKVHKIGYGTDLLHLGKATKYKIRE